MITKTINVYKFSELSNTAKEKAIQSERNKGIETNFIYDDAAKTVDAFHSIFNTNEGRNSWLEFNTNRINENILKLKGLRLRKYIINNFGDQLFKGKYFSLWSKTDKNYKYNKEGQPALKSRRSKVMFENSCVLTGVCYDNSLLKPLYEFLEWNLRPDYNSTQDFENLINNCFENLKKDIDTEIEYMNSDEAISESLEDNEVQFTEEGKIYNY